MHMYLLTQKRPQGDLRATNRQDSTDSAVMAGPSISRINQLFFSSPRKCRSYLLGQSPIRAIGVGALASRRNQACGPVVCSAPAKRRAHHQPKRYTSQRCGHTASHLFCNVAGEEPQRNASCTARCTNVWPLTVLLRARRPQGSKAPAPPSALESARKSAPQTG